ncbi:putative periplasmic protein [Salmonella enterica subsp. enterica serovar Newport str. CVM 4176]|nr:putative periplasmic protein [Salmonella enterica subsp. enterica serovar Newport str. CVM 4176]
MKTFSLVALILLLCSCSAPHHDSTQAVKQFYTSWMTTFTNDVNTPDDTTALMQRYVAKEVIHRLALIQSLYEQEIVGADYFMYAQDYAPEWIPQLRVGKAHPFLGGEKVDVLLGTESTPIHLEVYTRWEEGRWKIYRVRDADRGYEQPIYDAGASPRLRPGQRKSRRNIRSIKKGNRHRSLVRTGEVKAPLASGAYSVAENSKPKITQALFKI